MSFCGGTRLPIQRDRGDGDRVIRANVREMIRKPRHTHTASERERGGERPIRIPTWDDL